MELENEDRDRTLHFDQQGPYACQGDDKSTEVG